MPDKEALPEKLDELREKIEKEWGRRLPHERFLLTYQREGQKLEGQNMLKKHETQ